ncbi:hypothetical protein PVW48_11680 [Dinoroseobacter sp. PD6]|uniref:hypothetical protein n=1 Tax=Dinoroseobacter sp. PD6 TaxID=3028384 RepID=UPI00237B530C|nr:hypothetical protein [Dinoroseobacter sp. PD6]MDD9717410.1 hypothetical protein [Dinoroseobacter sp. PD6]
MKWLLACLLMLPGLALAQSSEVLPEELEIWVEIEETDHTPMVREMVLITLRGIYRRHITREEIIQPDLEGFSWTQLGTDTWREERLNGARVKTFTRRMAIYPDRAGTLTIGSFTHKLTLTNEADEWFEHRIETAPVSLDVAPASAGQGPEWWFPVKKLEISDTWSNAPDQLAPGEGVLRIVRVEALGATPEMLPPMPELTSPSAMIFPHPEKRFVELSPFGPISYAFWRWTIQPGNDTSTIVEPLTFRYFDTVTREDRKVTISAQRVAYGTVTPEASGNQQVPVSRVQAHLPGWPMGLLALVVFLGGSWLAVWGRQFAGLSGIHRFALFDPLSRELRRAARAGELAETRRCARKMLARDGVTPARAAMLRQFDEAAFDPEADSLDLQKFVRSFVAAKS